MPSVASTAVQRIGKGVAMGWYLRKSLKIGPLRINLSKSGLGGSVGVKGLRVGTGPRGRYLHAGREGLYYRASLNEPAGLTPEIEAQETAERATGNATDPIAGAEAESGRNQLGRRLLRGIFGGLMRGR
jgi:hypothetical protein